MPIACKYCVMTKGIRGTGENLVDGKQAMFDTYEELADHIEMEHDIPVQRENETDIECWSRFCVKNKRAGTENCQCPECVNNR